MEIKLVLTLRFENGGFKLNKSRYEQFPTI